MDVFAAVADPVRRSLLEQLSVGPARVVDLTRDRGISRPAVSRHLRLLAEAGLVRATDRGRERHYELVTEPLGEVVGWAAGLGGLAGSADPAAAGALAGAVSRPPVADHQLDALELEVRRTVRERTARPGARHTQDPPTTAGESA